MAGSSGLSREFKNEFKNVDEGSAGSSTPSSENQLGLEEGDQESGASEKQLVNVKDTRNWTLVSPSGNKLRARYYHAATVIGRKMLVVGGDSDVGMLNDVQQLHLGKLTWSTLGARGIHPQTKLSQHLPPCRGHSLIAWGKKLLLVAGETEPHNEYISVWSFDLEKESWSRVETKGELPVARTGQSVTRAGSVLILFGGEDFRGNKLNDLHMFDLKTLMWLPLLAMGSVPSPRSKHVAAIYDDRLLLVFGGLSKYKVLNDVYALDFEAMEWSRLKTRGVIPVPRAESAGVLVGDRWYIAGGEHSERRCLETLVLDVVRMTWSVAARSTMDSPSASQGFSMVIAQRKERAFLVAFGGKRPGPTNEIEVLHIPPSEHIQLKSPTLEKGTSGGSKVKGGGLGLHDTMIAVDFGVIPLERKFQTIEQTVIMDDSKETAQEKNELRHPNKEVMEIWGGNSSTRSKLDHGDIGRQADLDAEEKASVSELKASYEKKLAVVLQKQAALEAQLELVTEAKDEVEQSLASAIKSRQKTEQRLAIALKDIEALKKGLEAAEIAQEESNNLANTVHAENLRLDHELAFLKAVLVDTEKELHKTRSVLSGERSRAFQLQVELFELKQTLQNNSQKTSDK